MKIPEYRKTESGKKMGGKSVKLLLAIVMVAITAAAGILTLAPAAYAGAGWSLPVNVSLGTTAGNFEPQIALDADGQPHTVWTEYDEVANTSQVRYSTDPGSGWTAPAVLSPAGNNGAGPWMALDADSRPHVVWMGSDGVNDLIYYSAWTGSGWTAPHSISPGLTMNKDPQIALDADGRPHVVWRGIADTYYGTYYSTLSGSGWTAPVCLSPVNQNNYNHQMALDADGRPHVVWSGSNGTSNLILYSTNPGSGWTPPVDISPGTNKNVNPHIALDADGRPHVVWRASGSPGRQIYYSTNPGSGWTAALAVSTGYNTDSNPRITLDPGGKPHVVWNNDDGMVNYATDTGSGWIAPAVLSTSSIFNGYPEIALDPGGNPHVVWTGQVDSTFRIHYAKNTGSGWTNPYVLSTGINDNVYPQVALDTGGSPHVVWSGGEGNRQIWYSQDQREAFYFAEGYTGEGFQEYLCLGNPSGAALSVNVTYLYADGTFLDRTYDVPALSRFTADVNAEAGEDREVSIKCGASSSFVAERPMYFDYTGGGGSWTGGHDAVGAAFPSRAWYFAEGYTGPGFDEYVCVLNPGTADADLTFNFQTQEAGLIVPDGAYTVPAHSRATFKANELLGNQAYQTSLKLVSDAPVVAERAMYFDYQGTGSWGWTGGHCVMGTPSFEKEYFFAEGTTRPGFEEWLTLQNPGAAAITVHAVYQLGTGETVAREYTVPASGRHTAYVPDEVGPDQDASVRLFSASGFLAERPMYFDYQGTGIWGWTGGHCVIGATAQGAGWFFAEGYTGENFEEWLCIQNPGDADASVEITYYPEGGTPMVKDAVTVPANSRATVNVNTDAGAGLSICAGVSSDQPVIVERPMYFNFRGAWSGGHDVVGYMP